MESYKKLKLLFLIIISLSVSISTVKAQIQKLKISENNRFLVKEDGSPFVWIGETNWFFAKLPPNAIDSILDKRSSQGYTIIFISCRENLYNGDGPGGINNPNELWWAYLDEYINKCEQKNLYVGITLGWWGKAMSNSEKDLYNYGKWVGHRYKDKNNIIWLTLGEAGSHKRNNEIPDSKLNALIKGIRDSDTGNKLLTIHADYKRGTSLTNDSELCDFNNWQTSQWCCPNDLPRQDNRKWTVWEAITHDYQKLYEGIPKPTLDSEAWYENNKDFCGAEPFEIRRRAYFTIFAGAFGHTYGAGGIWDGLSSKTGCSENALSALNYPGAKDISFISRFLHSLGDKLLKIIPGQTMILEGNSENYDEHIQGVISDDGSFALVYSASDSPYKLDLSRLSKRFMLYTWYNPRSNKIITRTESINKTEKEYTFNPPGEFGPGNDWILVIGEKQFINKIKMEINKR